MKRVYIITLIINLLLLNMLSTGQELKLKEFKEFKGYEKFVNVARFSPFSNYFVITEGTNRVEIFNKHWEIIFEHQGDPDSYAGQAQFSSDEKFLVVSRYKSTNDIAVIQLPEATISDVLIEHTDAINGLAFSPDGKYLASCGDDKVVNVWRLENDRFILIHTFQEHKTRINELVFSNDNRFLISVSNDKTIIIKELVKDKVSDFQTIVEGKYYLKTIAYHPHKQEFVTGSSDIIKIWTLSKNHFVLKDSITEKVGSGYSLSFSPNGEYLVGSIVAVVRIWSYTDMGCTLEETIQRPVSVRFGVDFSQNGRYLSTSSMENVLIWEVEGISPSKKALIAEYLGKGLTTAQIRVLTPVNVDKVLQAIDKNLTVPKEEFETTSEYEARREKLKAVTLLEIQNFMEDFYKVTYKAKEQKIFVKIDELGTYNADNELYTMRILDMRAEARLPINEAKSLKENWNKANVTASKKISKDKMSFEYSNFQLVHPITGKEYKLIIDNPFVFTDEEALAEARNGSPVFKAETDTSWRDYGKTLALFFVTDKYDDPYISDLTNPVFDGNTIKEELANNYSVNVEFIENPGLNDIMGKLREYAAMTYVPGDKLVILFAGHGMFDEVFKEGYIIASDSKYADESKLTYLSHSNLRTIVNNIPCEHILLVLDVCFGGTFDPVIASRSAESDLYKDITKSEFINRKLKYKTRLYITSGGKEYVPDGRPGHHSPFARRFLEALRSYGGEDGIITINEILVHIEKVYPEPRFGEFGNNEPGSDFILIAK